VFYAVAYRLWYYVGMDEPRTKVLSNGAVYDLDKKRIVSGAVLTSDSARALVDARKSRKREAILEAGTMIAQTNARNSQHPAIQALQDDPDAMWKAVAIGRTVAAMDADSPYGNGAAEWLERASGLAEGKGSADTVASDTLEGVRDVIAEIANALRAGAEGQRGAGGGGGGV